MCVKTPVAEPGLEVNEGQGARIMVASSGPGYPFPEALTPSGMGEELGWGRSIFLEPVETPWVQGGK